MHIFISGASGNVGKPLVDKLSTSSAQIILGTRSSMPKTGKEGIENRYFDFEDKNSFASALKGVDYFFLLRPPQITDIDGVFKPLIAAAKAAEVKGIVFLSVQGAEKSNIIPHRKIEKLIVKEKVPYVFLRPGYFMQNLSSTLLKDITNKGKIILPAGNALFNWVDIDDISAVAAKTLLNFDVYSNTAMDITGPENLTFAQVVDRINAALHSNINYSSVNVLHFFFYKLRQGEKPGFIMVMLLLHFLPRFQEEPTISNNVEAILGRKPRHLEDFLHREGSVIANK